MADTRSAADQRGIAMADVLIQPLRDALRRCITVMNAKGGVGKTSLLANVGLLAAAALGYRVLLVEFDPQTHEGAGGNLGDDLGYGEDPAVDDDGAELAAAILEGRPVVPRSGVRERVDVVPGGNHLKKIVDHLHGQDDQYVAGALARVLAPIAHNYDLIFIDCPPGDDKMQTAALGAARWLISPTKPDKSSRKGLVSAGRKFQEILQYNPGIELLGVVLFAMPAGAPRVQSLVMQAVQDAFGGEAPILGSSVRAAVAPAFDAREQGLAIHEMTADGGGAGLRKKLLSRHKDGVAMTSRYARSAGPLADDYALITKHIVDHIGQSEGA